MYRRKEVPVIGCLSAKSLSLWKHHHNVFVFLHKWEFPDVSIILLLNYVSPPHFYGETYCFCPVHLSVTQFVSATPLKLLNRISWNLVDSKDTICICAYYEEILIAWILWELCPFELRNFPKFTTEAACQCNSSETTKQNFMKLGR
jgi:hypothetical protein